MSTMDLSNASTKIRVYASLCTIPDDSLFAFSPTLTTTTLNDSRLRWFEACFRQPTSAGLPPSFLQLRHVRRIILQTPLVCCGTPFPRSSVGMHTKPHLKYKIPIKPPRFRAIRVCFTVGKSGIAERGNDEIPEPAQCETTSFCPGTSCPQGCPFTSWIGSEGSRSAGNNSLRME